MQKLIAPSILSANFGNLQSEIELINKSNADWLHIDVMDGVFVPNISIGFPVIKAIKTIAKKPLDVHLMIINPDKYLDDFKKIGADILTVHFEACTHLHRTIQTIKQLGMKAGVSLNPHTNIGVLEDIISDIDIVLIMSVNPGFGGQKFIENTYDKITKLKNLISAKKSKCLIEIDGGVNLSNSAKLFECGADILVAGNAIFKSENPSDTIFKLKQLA